MNGLAITRSEPAHAKTVNDIGNRSDRSLQKTKLSANILTSIASAGRRIPFAYTRLATSDKVIVWFGVAMAAAFASLTWDLRPVPIDGWVDDWLYVRNAITMAHLQWLGPYNEITLIKRPLFSLVLAVPYVLHIPYSLFLYSLIFFTSAFLATSVSKIGVSKWIGVLFFVCLLFLPTFIDRESMRVVRDPVFICIQLLILAVVFQIVGTPRVQENRGRRRWMFACLFTLLALHVGMREEAVVFYPGLLIILVYYAATRLELSQSGRWIYGLKLLLAGAIAIQGSLLAIRTMNFAYYGVFILNEHEEGPFPEAMAAIASVRRPNSTTRTLISAPERKQLNALSPRFRKISGVLDVREEMTPQDCVDFRDCDNFDYSHAIFGIRTAGLRSLHITDAHEAAQFYRDLRMEIVALCESRQIQCESPVRRSMRPPFRSFNLPYLYEAVRVHLNFLLHFAHRGFSQDWSRVGNDTIADFERVTRQRYFIFDNKTGQPMGSLPASTETLQGQEIRRLSVSRIYANVGPYLISIGLLLFGIRVLLIPSWGVSAPVAVSTGLLVMIASRLAAITYISAVDNMMGNNYTVPSYGLVILFCFLSLTAIPELLRRLRLSAIDIPH